MGVGDSGEDSSARFVVLKPIVVGEHSTLSIELPDEPNVRCAVAGECWLDAAILCKAKKLDDVFFGF